MTTSNDESRIKFKATRITIVEYEIPLSERPEGAIEDVLAFEHSSIEDDPMILFDGSLEETVQDNVTLEIIEGEGKGLVAKTIFPPVIIKNGK